MVCIWDVPVISECDHDVISQTLWHVPVIRLLDHDVMSQTLR